MKALRYRQLKEKVPLSKAQINRLEAEDKFPKRFTLGPTSVAWDEAEIDKWLIARRDERGKSAPPGSSRPATANT